MNQCSACLLLCESSDSRARGCGDRDRALARGGECWRRSARRGDRGRSREWGGVRGRLLPRGGDCPRLSERGGERERSLGCLSERPRSSSECTRLGCSWPNLECTDRCVVSTGAGGSGTCGRSTLLRTREGAGSGVSNSARSVALSTISSLTGEETSTTVLRRRPPITGVAEVVTRTPKFSTGLDSVLLSGLAMRLVLRVWRMSGVCCGAGTLRPPFCGDVWRLAPFSAASDAPGSLAGSFRLPISIVPAICCSKRRAVCVERSPTTSWMFGI